MPQHALSYLSFNASPNTVPLTKFSLFFFNFFNLSVELRSTIISSSSSSCHAVVGALLGFLSIENCIVKDEIIKIPSNKDTKSAHRKFTVSIGRRTTAGNIFSKKKLFQSQLLSAWCCNYDCELIISCTNYKMTQTDLLFLSAWLIVTTLMIFNDVPKSEAIDSALLMILVSFTPHQSINNH